MARMISIAKGRTNVELPDGRLYNGGTKIILTQQHWAAINPALITSKTIFDWGEVPEPVPGPVGPIGPAGPVGEQGPVGGAGPTGPPGSVGPTGIAWMGPWDPTVTYVVNQAVADAGVFFIAVSTNTDQRPSTLPVRNPFWGALSQRGDQGDVGPVGPQGPAGPAGVQGEQGIPGLPGGPGVQGDKGSRGEDGFPGAPGPIGEPGATGPQGVPGEVGPAGPKGDTGQAGPAGPAGPAGVKGDKGDTGAAGTAGAQGIQGPAGAAGAQGLIGPQGPRGITGIVTRTTVATAANTAADVSIVSTTIPANTLAVGTTYRLILWGLLTTGTAAPNFLVKAKLGTSFLAYTIGPGNSRTNAPWRLTFDLTIRTIGGSGSYMVASQSLFMVTPGLLGPTLLAADTTTALVLDLSFTWATANANASARCELASIELVKS